MEGTSRRGPSNAGSEKMERDSDRQKEMEGHHSTGQGSQRAVVPMEEEEEDGADYKNCSLLGNYVMLSGRSLLMF